MKQPDKPRKPREKPLSLYPLSFDEAVEQIVKVKPHKTTEPPSQSKPAKAK
jgi:hypothetical protein